MILVYLQGSKCCFKKWFWFTYNAVSSVSRNDAGLVTIHQVLFQEIIMVYLQWSKFFSRKWSSFTYNASSSVLRNDAVLITTKHSVLRNDPGLLTMQQVLF